jgi:hypothetical protein
VWRMRWHRPKEADWLFGRTRQGQYSFVSLAEAQYYSMPPFFANFWNSHHPWTPEHIGGNRECTSAVDGSDIHCSEQKRRQMKRLSRQSLAKKIQMTFSGFDTDCIGGLGAVCSRACSPLCVTWVASSGPPDTHVCRSPSYMRCCRTRMVAAPSPYLAWPKKVQEARIRVVCMVEWE